MNLFGKKSKKASTLANEHAKVEQARNKMQSQLDDSFANLFFLMHQTLETLQEGNHLIEHHKDVENEKKANTDNGNS